MFSAATTETNHEGPQALLRRRDTRTPRRAFPQHALSAHWTRGTSERRDWPATFHLVKCHLPVHCRLDSHRRRSTSADCRPADITRTTTDGSRHTRPPIDRRTTPLNSVTRRITALDGGCAPMRSDHGDEQQRCRPLHLATAHVTGAGYDARRNFTRKHAAESGQVLVLGRIAKRPLCAACVEFLS